MHPEIIRYEPVGNTGTPPWQSGERDNWYAIHVVKPTGTGLSRVRRTAHAAAIGRAILAEYADPDITRVEVYRYDNDRAPVAVVTDTRPVNYAIEKLEQSLEVALPAQWEYEALRAEVEGAVAGVYAASNRLDETDPSYRSANALAKMVHGLISRPTVLKQLRVTEETADL